MEIRIIIRRPIETHWEQSKLRDNSTKTQKEQERSQSQTNRTLENISNVNKTEKSDRTTSEQSDNSTLNSSRKPAIADNEKMDRENFHHWRQPVNLWKISDGETTVRKRKDWWSKETRYLDRVHQAVDMTSNAEEQYSRHSNRTKEAGKRLPKLTRSS